MSDYADDESQGVVTRVKVIISLRINTTTIDK